VVGLLEGELYCLVTVAVHNRCLSFRIGYNSKRKHPKTHDNILYLVALRPNSVSWPPLTGLCDHIHWTHTLGWTPLDEWSAHLPDNTQRSQETSTLPAGFEPPTSEQPQTHAVDRASTGIDHGNLNLFDFFSKTTLLRRSHLFQKHSLVYILLHYFFELVLKTNWKVCLIVTCRADVPFVMLLFVRRVVHAVCHV
jgi:hypothetical protein